MTPLLPADRRARPTHHRMLCGHRLFMPNTRILRTTERDLHGIAKRTLQQQAKDGVLERLAPGQYLSAANITPEERWLARLEANLRRAPQGSAISHRAAARLHGLEGFTAGPLQEDISVPTNSGWRTRPAIRCGEVDDADVVMIKGLRVTSIAQTLADLGRVVGLDQLEFAVEHALRATIDAGQMCATPTCLAICDGGQNSRISRVYARSGWCWIDVEINDRVAVTRKRLSLKRCADALTL